MASKYAIEDNIDFYAELNKAETEEITEECDTCKITGMPLGDYFVELECGHKYNYMSLYNEIYNQKHVFKTYTLSSLPKQMQMKMFEEQINYYIRCPYCRNIQTKLLPYHYELGISKKYGINTNDPSLKYQIEKYGTTFDLIDGQLCYHGAINNNCHSCDAFVTKTDDDTYLCMKHYKKHIDKKKRQKNAVKKNIKKNTNENNNNNACVAILKSGINKGKLCGCKVAFDNNLCKRHISVK